MWNACAWTAAWSTSHFGVMAHVCLSLLRFISLLQAQTRTKHSVSNHSNEKVIQELELAFSTTLATTHPLSKGLGCHCLLCFLTKAQHAYAESRYPELRCNSTARSDWQPDRFQKMPPMAVGAGIDTYSVQKGDTISTIYRIVLNTFHINMLHIIIYSCS